MAPDYDEIRKSKFGTEGKAKKRSRVKYEASPALLSSTQKLLKRWDKESVDLKKEKQSDEVGGAKEISRQGSGNLLKTKVKNKKKRLRLWTEGSEQQLFLTLNF